MRLIIDANNERLSPATINPTGTGVNTGKSVKFKKFLNSFFTVFVPAAFMCDPLISLSLEKIDKKNRET
jgi:hypothetical protein